VGKDSYSATEGGSVSEIVTYGYDANGVRISRAAWNGSSVTTTDFGMDDWNPAAPSGMGTENDTPILELNASGSLVTRDINGPGDDNTVATENSSGTVNWNLTDYQGSTRLVINNSGTVLSSITYDANGNVVSGTLSGGPGYTGQRQDALTGLISMGNGERDENPKTGRFNQTDSGGFDTSGPNLYTYANNAPTDGTDPSGEEDKPKIQQEARTGRFVVTWPSGMQGFYKTREAAQEAIAEINEVPGTGVAEPLKKAFDNTIPIVPVVPSSGVLAALGGKSLADWKRDDPGTAAIIEDRIKWEQAAKQQGSPPVLLRAYAPQITTLAF
jgi:RHS repeat-associated protein